MGILPVGKDSVVFYIGNFCWDFDFERVILEIQTNTFSYIMNKYSRYAAKALCKHDLKFLKVLEDFMR